MFIVIASGIERISTGLVKVHILKNVQFIILNPRDNLLYVIASGSINVIASGLIFIRIFQENDLLLFLWILIING